MVKEGTMSISRELSVKIFNMGFICSCMVVLLHIGTGAHGDAQWVADYLSNGVCRAAVPSFFIMSGFFLAKHSYTQGWYYIEIRKRIRSLLVPFFVWLFLFDVFGIGITILANIIHGRDCWQNLRTGFWALSYIGLYVYDAPYLYVLWYIRCLFFLVLMSPLVFFFCRLKLGFFLPLILFAANIYLRDFACVKKLLFFFPISAPTYFAVGACLAFGTIKLPMTTMSNMLRLIVCLFIIVVAICSVILTPDVAMLLFGMALFILMPERHLPFSNYSFPIFILHPFLLVMFSVLGYKTCESALNIFLLLIATVFCSILITKLISKSSSRVFLAIFGGRGVQ